MGAWLDLISVLNPELGHSIHHVKTAGHEMMDAFSGIADYEKKWKLLKNITGRILDDTLSDDDRATLYKKRDELMEYFVNQQGFSPQEYKKIYGDHYVFLNNTLVEIDKICGEIERYEQKNNIFLDSDRRKSKHQAFYEEKSNKLSSLDKIRNRKLRYFCIKQGFTLYHFQRYFGIDNPLTFSCYDSLEEFVEHYYSEQAETIRNTEPEQTSIENETVTAAQETTGVKEILANDGQDSCHVAPDTYATESNVSCSESNREDVVADSNETTNGPIATNDVKVIDGEEPIDRKNDSNKAECQVSCVASPTCSNENPKQVAIESKAAMHAEEGVEKVKAENKVEESVEEEDWSTTMKVILFVIPLFGFIAWLLEDNKQKKSKALKLAIGGFIMWWVLSNC